MIKGQVAYLFAFDLANEIDTSKVQKVLSKKAVTLELKLHKSRPKDLLFSKPLEVEPNVTRYKFEGNPVQVIIRIYEVGAVNISLRVPFAVEKLDQLFHFHDLKLDNEKTIGQIAANLCAKVKESIQDSLIRPHGENIEPEAYTVFCVRELNTQNSTQEFLEKNKAEIVGLISEIRPQDVSESLIKEISQSALSFEKTDLAVIDWDAAFIVDVSGDAEDTLYALEVANLQLEEVKFLDRLIDRQMDQSYQDLRKESALFGQSNQLTLKRLREVRIDTVRLKDEILNTAKFFGDWYLARVYMAAREKFKIMDWQRSIDDKLNHLNQLYSVISTDTTNRKMIWLEALIVILFILDLFAVFFLE